MPHGTQPQTRPAPNARPKRSAASTARGQRLQRAPQAAAGDFERGDRAQRAGQVQTHARSAPGWRATKASAAPAARCGPAGPLEPTAPASRAGGGVAEDPSEVVAEQDRQAACRPLQADRHDAVTGSRPARPGGAGRSRRAGRPMRPSRNDPAAHAGAVHAAEQAHQEHDNSVTSTMHPSTMGRGCRAGSAAPAVPLQYNPGSVTAAGQAARGVRPTCPDSAQHRRGRRCAPGQSSMTSQTPSGSTNTDACSPATRPACRSTDVRIELDDEQRLRRRDPDDAGAGRPADRRGRCLRAGLRAARATRPTRTVRAAHERAAADPAHRGQPALGARPDRGPCARAARRRAAGRGAPGGRPPDLRRRRRLQQARSARTPPRCCGRWRRAGCGTASAHSLQRRPASRPSTYGTALAGRLRARRGGRAGRTSGSTRPGRATRGRA